MESRNLLPLEGYEAALDRLPDGIRQAEVNAMYRQVLSLAASNGALCQTESARRTALYVRSAGAGGCGNTYTEDLSEDPVQVIRRAAEGGAIAPAGSLARLHGPAHICPDPDCRPTPPDLAGAKAAVLALEQAGRLASPEVVSATARLKRLDFVNRVANSEGGDVSGGHTVWSARLELTVRHGDSEYNAESFQNAAALDQLNPEELACRALEQARRQFDPQPFQPGVYPAVLDRTVVINILTTAWQLFSGAKYAAGASALSGKLGQVVASPAVSLRDLPSHPAAGYRYPFDCEGTPGQETDLITNGVLTGLLQTVASADALGMEPTGNAGRVALLSGNIPTDLIVVPKITCLMPGTASLPELLAHMGDGVYINESYDVFHSINIASGAFSIPCRAMTVRDGRPVSAHGGLTISGNLTDLLAQVEEAGSDLLLDEFLLNSYCVGGPSLRLASLRVNG